MAIINRYNTTIRGSVVMTGNTMGLAQGGGSVTNISNFATGIITPPAGGTTTTSSANSSQGKLVLPAGASVVYAELNWGGNAANGTPTPAPYNNSIQLTDPLNITTTIAVNSATTQVTATPTPGGYALYNQSVDVTTVVKNAGAGFYRFNGEPGLIGDGGIGWCLIVIYSLGSESFRNINIWSLNNSNPTTVTITGFSTPSTGTVTGKLIVAANNGQPSATGESMLFGPNSSSLVTLSGPNNNATNFFASQINDINGNLDTTGTWGTSNATPGSLPATGNRLNYDLTRVDVSAGLTNNQNTATISLSNAGDLVFLNALALQVDVNSASLTPISKIVDKAFADIGDTLTYTITFKNSGAVTANNSIFIDTVPNGTTFLSDSFFLNTGFISGTTPNSPGVSIGNIGPNQATTISFKVTVNTIPSPNPIPNQAGVGYKFISAPGLTPINAFDSSSIVQTRVYHTDLNLSKEVNRTFANVGNTLTYTIPITTVGNATLYNVVLIDTIPNDTSIIANTLNVNGVQVSGSTNPPGLSLGTLPANSVTTVSFQVLILTIPSPNPILNIANVGYRYNVDPSIPVYKSSSSSSNTTNTKVNNANLKNIVKIVDRSYAECGDIINYKIVIPNIGNVTAQNVFFKDTVPNGTVFEVDSVYINDIRQLGVNPNTGFSIPNISPGTTTTVTFNVIVQC